MGISSQVRRAMQVLLRARQVIPREVLANARGLCVVTEVKGALFVSAQVGRGILLKRVSRYRFGYPSSVMCFGMGAGAQWGGEKIDHVIVINDDRTLRAMESTLQLRLGGEYSVAAGPSGRDGQGFASIGTRGAAACLSYSIAKGAFVGVSLEGSFFCQNRFANRRFYRSGFPVSEILNGTIPLVGEAINVTAELNVFLYELVQDEVGGSGRILPLASDSFEEVVAERQAFERRRENFRRSSRDLSDEPDGAEPGVRAQARAMLAAMDRDYDGEEGDDDTICTASSGSEGEAAAQAFALAQEGGYNPFPKDGAAVDEHFVELGRSQYALDLQRLRDVKLGGTSSGRAWLNDRLKCGPTLEFKCDHIVNEAAPEFAEHGILSARKGEVATLVDGDLNDGLPLPYQEYVLVHLGKDRVGRVSKHCLEAYSKNPFSGTLLQL